MVLSVVVLSVTVLRYAREWASPAESGDAKKVGPRVLAVFAVRRARVGRLLDGLERYARVWADLKPLNSMALNKIAG